MSKEIYISTTPHETRLAIVEDEQLAEIYYERENEYTLAGSIYNGKVTRVLPGMQSAFVDVGLERDAFLYVTDFMEEQGDAADFESDGGSRRQAQPAREQGEERPSRDREGRRGRRNERGDRRPQATEDSDAGTPAGSTTSFDEPIAPTPNEPVDAIEAGSENGGSRRWRGRRGRRRGRAFRADDQAPSQNTAASGTEGDALQDDVVLEGGYVEALDAADDASSAIEIDLGSEPEAAEPSGSDFKPQDRGDRRGRGRRNRGDRPDSRERSTPVYDNSYAGYYDDQAATEPTGEPIVLPGESIRKYRDPAEVAAEEEEARRNAPPKPEVLTVSAPSIEIVGWDGGAVLPGESLGRHRGRSSAARSTAPAAAPEPQSVPPADSFDQPAPAPQADAEPAPQAGAEPFLDQDIAPAEIVMTVEQPAAASAPEAPGETLTAAPEADDATSSATAEAGVEPSAEYEPEEGASASVNDSARRDLRRFEQAPEQQEADAASAPDEVAPTPSSATEREGEDATTADAATPGEQADSESVANAPDQTTYDLSPAAGEPKHAEVSVAGLVQELPENFTTLQASGEMFSAPVEERAGEHLPQESAATPHEQDSILPPTPVEQEGAVQSVASSDAENAPVAVEFTDETEESSLELHAYGDGDFYEEEMEEEADEETFAYSAADGLDDTEAAEYEEETLQDGDDLGSLLHEMSQDHTSEEVEVDAAGGFTAEDFGGEPDDDEDEDEAAEEPAPGGATEQRSRGEGQRRQGGGRDRRGGRNSGGDRGRGRRPSMQTTDLPAINELLKPGQEILVQIAKEPIAKKGARITSHIALPGRFLVFMPTVNHTGVSRKISSDEERRRLKSILLSEKGDAQGGFIVRTAADGASEEELRNDLRFLIHLWNDIKARSESSKSPALIYHDLNLVERILRDQVTDNFSAIWVDTEQEYERVLRFLQRFQPSLVRRVKLYTKETPLFEHFGVTQEIDKALKSKVWLKSGGSIVINQTEALVAIDINTGKYVGKTARLEDTILKTNLDAIPEIVRQIRLRDLGGIIVIDFIDMDERKNRAKVLQTLEDAMRTDRAPSKILPFNDFGLVIMTRKRVKQSLERTLCIPDPVTEGTGMIKSPVTIANEIYIEMRKMHRHLEKTDVMLRVHPEVVKTLKANGGKRLQELEDMTRKTILVKSDPSLSPEAFDIH